LKKSSMLKEREEEKAIGALHPNARARKER
jgi:hypothetical protein